MEEFKNIMWFVGILGAWIASYYTTKFQTKQNTKDLDSLSTKVSSLDDKCKESISSKEAYKSFVSREMLELHLKSIENKIDGLAELIKSERK